MKEYGLLGHPLGHSFSRTYFNNKFAREGIDAEYLNFDIDAINQLPALLAAHPNLRGLNVTIPYKQQVIPYLDELSDEAQAIGAVNVIKITRIGQLDNLQSDRSAPCDASRLKNSSPCAAQLSNCKLSNCKLIGFNSDIIGFRESIRPLLQPHHKRALVLGTGGASKAVCRALEQLGIEWRYVSRQRTTNLPSLTGEGSGERRFTYSDITPSLLADYTVIVNCTPLGMYPRIDCAPEIPYAALSPRHLLYDLVYNPDITLFMRQGRRYGATVKNGLEMLHLQAEASWKFWNEST